MRSLPAILLIVCISAGDDYDDILQWDQYPQHIYDNQEKSSPIDEPFDVVTQYDQWVSAFNPRASTDMTDVAPYPESIPLPFSTNQNTEESIPNYSHYS